MVANYSLVACWRPWLQALPSSWATSGGKLCGGWAQKRWCKQDTSMSHDCHLIRLVTATRMPNLPRHSIMEPAFGHLGNHCGAQGIWKTTIFGGPSRPREIQAEANILWSQSRKCKRRQILKIRAWSNDVGRPSAAPHHNGVIHYVAR